MYLKHLSLLNYRNYARLEVDLQARIHVLRGDNAQGKTNLLEVIHYLATTKSPLAGSDRQMIRWAADRDVIPYAQVQATFVRAGVERAIEITLVKEVESEGGRSALRRQILLDGIPRRAMDVVGKLNVVLFLPQDIGLVSGSPRERRRYLDMLLCQVDEEYCRALSRYNKVITQRNALLRQIRQRLSSPSELDYWDEQLARLGTIVLSRRQWATQALNEGAAGLQRALTGDTEDLVVIYQSSLAEYASSRGEALWSQPGGEDEFRRVLQLARVEESARGITLVGPHRDDLKLLLNGVDATIYGSRGQQRTIALALKLAEVGLIESQTGDTPILLLDDVISELDDQRCAFLLDSIAVAEQVLITTTKLDRFAPGLLESAALWQVVSGTLSPLA